MNFLVAVVISLFIYPCSGLWKKYIFVEVEGMEVTLHLDAASEVQQLYQLVEKELSNPLDEQRERLLKERLRKEIDYYNSNDEELTYPPLRYDIDGSKGELVIKVRKSELIMLRSELKIFFMIYEKKKKPKCMF